MISRWQRLPKRYPLFAFFALAYALSWAVSAPAAVLPQWPGILEFFMVFGPAAAAFVIVAVTEGEAGVKQLLTPLKQWRVGFQWYLVVLVGPAVTMVVAVALYRFFGAGSQLPDLDRLWSSLPLYIGGLLVLCFYQLIIIWGEEIGWRGYALPRLQARTHPLLASVIVGVLWGFWHLPYFWNEGTVHNNMSLPFFVLSTIGYAILYTWVYNGTRGSLFLVCLLHAANNTTVSYTMIAFTPLIEEPLFSLLVLALFDVLIILLAGPRLLHRQRPIPTQITGQPSRANKPSA